MGVAQKTSNGLVKQHNEQHKQQRGKTYRNHRISVNFSRIFRIFIGKTEKSGLHSVSEDDQQKGCPGKQIGYNSVFCRIGEFVCIERHKQPVEKFPYNAAHSVNGGILRQRFHFFSHNQNKLPISPLYFTFPKCL